MKIKIIILITLFIFSFSIISVKAQERVPGKISTGYGYKEEIVHNEHTKDFFKK